MWFYPSFIVYILVISIIWLYDEMRISKDFDKLRLLSQESDFEFILAHLGRTEFQKENHKRIKFALGCSCFPLFFFEEFSSKQILIVVFCFVLFYKGYYCLIKKQYERKLEEASQYFPYYLNNLCILIQSNSLAVALMKSIDNAPDIFKNDLEILVKEIHLGKSKGIKPYLDFYHKFSSVQDLKRVMKTLYSVSVASNQKEKLMLSLTKITEEKVSIARKEKFDQYLQKQAIIPWILFVWVGFVLIASFSAINLGAFLS